MAARMLAAEAGEEEEHTPEEERLFPVDNHRATLTGAKVVNRGQTAAEPALFHIQAGTESEAEASSRYLPLPADRDRNWVVPPVRQVPPARLQAPAHTQDRVRTRGQARNRVRVQNRDRGHTARAQARVEALRRRAGAVPQAEGMSSAWSQR